MTSHKIVFQTTRYARIGLNLEAANSIVLQYAEHAENILLRQEIAILQAEQINRKVRVKQAEKEAKAQEKQAAKDAKSTRRGQQRNASTANVARVDDASVRAHMYSNIFTPTPVAKRTTEGGNSQMYGNLFKTKDIRDSEI